MEHCIVECGFRTEAGVGCLLRGRRRGAEVHASVEGADQTRTLSDNGGRYTGQVGCEDEWACLVTGSVMNLAPKRAIREGARASGRNWVTRVHVGLTVRWRGGWRGCERTHAEGGA